MTSRINTTDVTAHMAGGLTWSDLRLKGWLDHTYACRHFSNEACSCGFSEWFSAIDAARMAALAVSNRAGGRER